MNMEKIIKGCVTKNGACIARDSHLSKQLEFHTGKPSRNTTPIGRVGISQKWMSLGPAMYIDSTLFPDLKLEDEPIEVEMVIKTKTIDYVKRKD